MKRDLDKIKSDVSLNYDEKLKRAEARISEMESAMATKQEQYHALLTDFT